MPLKNCAIPNCGTLGVSASRNNSLALHRYPNPKKHKQRYLEWARLSGPVVQCLHPEFVYKCRRICTKHFEEKYRLRCKRLSRIALPTLLLPDVEGKPLWTCPNQLFLSTTKQFLTRSQNKKKQLKLIKCSCVNSKKLNTKVRPKTSLLKNMQNIPDRIPCVPSKEVSANVQPKSTQDENPKQNFFVLESVPLEDPNMSMTKISCVSKEVNTEEQPEINMYRNMPSLLSYAKEQFLNKDLHKNISPIKTPTIKIKIRSSLPQEPVQAAREPSIETPAELSLEGHSLLKLRSRDGPLPLYKIKSLLRVSGKLTVSRFKCPICQIMMVKKRLLRHYKHVHKLKMKTTMKRFSSKEKFQIWKKKIETENNASFVKKYLPKLGNSSVKTEEYVCHRNGLFKLGKSKKMLKFVGLNKIDGYCPAKMLAFIQPDGRVTVLYTMSHLGHDAEKSAEPDEPAKQIKCETILTFDKIQAEALNEDTDDRSSPTETLKQEIVSDFDVLFEREKIKTELHRIIDFIDELQSNANVKAISKMLSPVISNICKWRETLHVPQVLVPLFKKELSKSENISNPQEKSVMLPIGTEILANPGHSLEGTSDIPIAPIDNQLKKEIGFSDRLPKETLFKKVGVDDTQHLPKPAPVVKSGAFNIMLNKKNTECKYNDKSKRISLLKPINAVDITPNVQQYPTNVKHEEIRTNVIAPTKKNWPKVSPGTSLVLDITKTNKTRETIKSPNQISAPAVPTERKSLLTEPIPPNINSTMKKSNDLPGYTCKKKIVKILGIKYFEKPGTQLKKQKSILNQSLLKNSQLPQSKS